MLLPSALPCDFLAPSLARSSAVTIASSSTSTALTRYHSPPLEDSGIISTTTTGLLHTCRRLQQILSGSDRPTPMTLATSTTITTAASTTTTQPPKSDPPRTPSRRRVAPLRTLPNTPVRRNPNKRTRAAAFSCDDSSSPSSSFEDPTLRCFATPARKRLRLTTTPPPAPNPRRRARAEEWTDGDDRQLVALVLGKLRLSRGEWEECARTLGKGDGRTLGRRWEAIVRRRLELS